MLKNTVQTNQNQNGVVYQSGDQEINLTPEIVRQYITTNPNISGQEIFMFVKKAESLHLNPFLNEIYLVKFGNKPAQFIVSKGAFMRIANNNPHFKGIKAGIVVARGNEMKFLRGALSMPGDTLIGGWAEVHRDDREPTHIEIGMDEFSKGQSTWKSMPKTMIRKTAEVQALREAFPESLNGAFTEDDADMNDKTQSPKSVKADESKKDDVSQLINAKTKKYEPKKESKSEPKSEDKDVKELDPKEEQSVEQILNAQNSAADSMEGKDVDKKEDVENDAQGELFKRYER